jgi:Nucleotide-diphospho-sugar transferase
MLRDCGVIFVATGEKHYQWAIEGARSVRETNRDVPVTLFSELGEAKWPFTDHRRIERPHRRSKVDCIPLTPYERTIYLDTDCRVACDLKPIFALLDRFDIAMAHKHNRNTRTSLRSWHVKVPDAFPQLNSGVIAFRRTDPVIAALKEWARDFDEADLGKDQVTLREILWTHPLNLYILPPEYNYRRDYHHEPKILHLKLAKKERRWPFKFWQGVR